MPPSDTCFLHNGPARPRHSLRTRVPRFPAPHPCGNKFMLIGGAGGKEPFPSTSEEQEAPSTVENSFPRMVLLPVSTSEMYPASGSSSRTATLLGQQATQHVSSPVPGPCLRQHLRKPFSDIIKPLVCVKGNVFGVSGAPKRNLHGHFKRLVSFSNLYHHEGIKPSQFGGRRLDAPSGSLMGNAGCETDLTTSIYNSREWHNS